MRCLTPAFLMPGWSGRERSACNNSWQPASWQRTRHVHRSICLESSLVLPCNDAAKGTSAAKPTSSTREDLTKCVAGRLLLARLWSQMLYLVYKSAVDRLSTETGPTQRQHSPKAMWIRASARLTGCIIPVMILPQFELIGPSQMQYGSWCRPSQSIRIAFGCEALRAFDPFS